MVRLWCGFDSRKFRIVFVRDTLGFRPKLVSVGGRFGFVFFFRFSSRNQPRGKTAEKGGQGFSDHLWMLILIGREMANSFGLIATGPGSAGAGVAGLLLVRVRRDFGFGKYCMGFYRDAVDFRDTLFSVGSGTGFGFFPPLSSLNQTVGKFAKEVGSEFVIFFRC